MQRLFAHKIIYSGRTYTNHVIELADDGTVSLYPFEREIHSTRFISGAVKVEVSTSPLRLVAEPAGDTAG